jgi:DNA-binding response OmpR family regulator
MPTKGFFTDYRSTSTQEIDSHAVIGLAISPFEENLSFLQRMFQDAGWKLLTANKRAQAVEKLVRERITVVICERHLIDGNWKDVLSHIAAILNPPRLIVVSRFPDDELWIEVLNMGGFDLLSAPLREVEVVHAVGSAVLDWMEAQKQIQLRY